MRRLVKALLVLAVIVGGLLVLILLTSKLYRIPSSAMESTLHCAKLFRTQNRNSNRV